MLKNKLDMKTLTASLFVFVGYFYAFSKISFYNNLALLDALLVFGLVYFAIVAKEERKSFPVKLLGLTILYILVAWLIGTNLYPDLYSSKISIHQITKFYLFLIFAFFLTLDENRVWWFLGLASAGLMLTPFTMGHGIQEILQGFNGVRINFGLQNAQHTSLLFGSVLLGSIVFFRRALLTKNKLIIFFVGSLLILSSIAFYFSSTRTMYLALFASLLSFIFYALFFFGKKAKIIAFATSVVALAFLAVISQSAYNKFEKELHSIEASWEGGDITSISHTSLGARLTSWKAGLEWVEKSPLIGWGSKGGKLVAEKTEWMQGMYPSTFGHMHNSYMEMLVRYGLIGFILILTLVIWVGVGLIKAKKAGYVPEDMFIFLNLFFVYWLVANLTESYLFYWTGDYLLTLITAIAVSYVWKSRSRERLS